MFKEKRKEKKNKLNNPQKTKIKKKQNNLKKQNKPEQINISNLKIIKYS